MSVESDVHTILKILVFITCILSVIGSLLIIISYAFFKSLRTYTRLILVHLSIMDLGTALANMVGTAVNFDAYYTPNPINATFIGNNDTNELLSIETVPDPPEVIKVTCVSQALLASYFTLGSFMWTLSMAGFLYLKTVRHSNHDRKLEKKIIYGITVFCYSFPLVFVIWALSTDRLGYTSDTAEGWCSTQMIDDTTGKRQYLMSVLAYNIWVLLNYILVPILYIGVLLHIRSLREETKKLSIVNTPANICSYLDAKLLLIPLFFLLLRIWSFISDVFILYADVDLDHHTGSRNAHYALLILAGIGDSGQGFMNAILFVLMTKRVRDRLFCSRNCYCCKSKEAKTEKQPITEEGSTNNGIQGKTHSSSYYYSLSH